MVLNFTDFSGQPAPPSQVYSVTTTSSTNFTVTAPGLSTGTYTQMVNVTISNMLTASMVTTNVITVAISGHGLTVGNPVYLNFVTSVANGPATNGVYQIINTTNANSFSVIAVDGINRGGNCLIPKLTGGGFVVSQKTNLLYSTGGANNAPLPHGLSPGDSVYINFTQAGSPADGQFQVVTVPDASHFTCVISTTNNQTQNGSTAYPLAAPHLNRSGMVTVNWGTWLLNATDTGGTYSLAQTPLKTRR